MKTSIGAALLAAGSVAQAQSVAVAAPPSLAVPDGELGDERKFFLFHKAGVSLEQARADLGFCSRYIPKGRQRSLPTFVAWKSEDPAAPIPVAVNYGLVGVAILSIIDGPLDRSIRQARMMRCMLPRGYARYRTSEGLWKQINAKDRAASVEIQAQIAAGPVPPTPRTLP